MANLKALLAILLATWGSLATAKTKSKAESAILLSKVKTLTLHGDKKTSHRRVSPIPQLTCVGGSGCKHYNVDTMRCQNAGSEYDTEDIQWTCTASLPSDFKLGSTEVICEGYDNADDAWVLKGSCGVEYRLLLNEEGERRYGSSKQGSFWSGEDDYYPSHGGKSGDSPSRLAQLLFWLVFVGIICLILWRIFNPVTPHPGPAALGGHRPGWGGGGGGGDNDPFDDPPPPYSPRGSYQGRTKPSSSRPTTGGSSRAAGGNNFWTGAATGAAAAGAAGYSAGYYHGSRTSENERRQQERARNPTSSWFGSGGGAGGRGAGSPSFSANGSSPSPSSSRHESTGFGGTRRR